jgi:hypothetical protein
LPEELRGWQPKKEAKELFVTFEYMQYRTAKAWGRTPSEWGLLDKKDKVIMMAFDKAENLIAMWHREEADKASKIERKKIEKRHRDRPKDTKGR